MSITKHNAPDHIFCPDTPPEMPRIEPRSRFDGLSLFTRPDYRTLGIGLSNRSLEAKAERARLRIVLKYLKARNFHEECLARARLYPDLDTTRLAADLKAFWRRQWLTSHEWNA